jgi:hypothetical protein
MLPVCGEAKNKHEVGLKNPHRFHRGTSSSAEHALNYPAAMSPCSEALYPVNFQGVDFGAVGAIEL